MQPENLGVQSPFLGKKNKIKECTCCKPINYNYNTLLMPFNVIIALCI